MSKKKSAKKASAKCSAQPRGLADASLCLIKGAWNRCLLGIMRLGLKSYEKLAWS